MKVNVSHHTSVSFNTILLGDIFISMGRPYLKVGVESAFSLNDKYLVTFDHSLVVEPRDSELSILPVGGGPAVAPVLTEQEKEEIRRGEYINAVRNVRTRLGWGLRESKDLVDAYRDVLAAE